MRVYRLFAFIVGVILLIGIGFGACFWMFKHTNILAEVSFSWLYVLSMVVLIVLWFVLYNRSGSSYTIQEEKMKEKVSSEKRILLESLRETRTISENQYWEWRSKIDPKSIE